MDPVHATRAGRLISAAVTVILTLAFALAAGAVDPAGSAADHARPRPVGQVGQVGRVGRVGPGARAADACDGQAILAVSDRRPTQLRPVQFSAAASTVPAGSVVFYDFDYGDGSDDAGSQPTAIHAYQEAGTYTAKLSIVTSCNTVVTSGAIQMVVGDGLPPSVAVAFPLADHVTHFGRAGLLLRGTAKDPSGVRKVELAIQLLRVKTAAVARTAGARVAAAKKPAAKKPAATGPRCYWYDGKITLRARGCATPLFFAAHLSGSHWSFRMNPRSKIPPGVYTVRVRATDRAGNVTTIFSTKLGNILAFELVA